MSDADALNAAYRKGQEDMRRRAADMWRGWYDGDISAHCARFSRAAKHGKVSVRIRALKLHDLPPTSKPA